jgi:hypothetical protein
MTELEAIDGLKALVGLLMYYAEEGEPGNARRITELVLSELEITDDLMRGVVGYLDFLPHLEFLDLGANAFTDDALPLLRDLRQLKRLDLEDNDLSSEAVDRLRSMLPNCQINLELPEA